MNFFDFVAGTCSLSAQRGYFFFSFSFLLSLQFFLFFFFFLEIKTVRSALSHMVDDGLSSFPNCHSSPSAGLVHGN